MSTANRKDKDEKRIQTGIEGLDKMLHGGFIPGRNILVSGSAGSGKSTIAAHFVMNSVMSDKRPTLYITLEESKEKLIRDMGLLGIRLDKFEDTGRLMVIGGPLSQVKSYMSKVDATMDNLVQEIEEVVKENDIERVVIDSINPLTVLAEGDAEKRNSLAAISNVLSSLGCTAVFVFENSSDPNDIHHSSFEEFIVDGVISLHQFHRFSGGAKMVPGILIKKMRGTSHEKNMKPYEITDKGIRVHADEMLFLDDDSGNFGGMG